MKKIYEVVCLPGRRPRVVSVDVVEETVDKYVLAEHDMLHFGNRTRVDKDTYALSETEAIRWFREDQIIALARVKSEEALILGYLEWVNQR
jgi:hypothetical protein